MALRSKMQRSSDQASAIDDEMSENASAVKAEAAKIVSMIRDLGAEGMSDVKAALRDQLPDVNLEGTLNSMTERLAEELRAHPMRSLGVAALAGLALGVMLRR